MAEPLKIQGFTSKDIHDKIHLLTTSLVNIKDNSGEFLLRLPDGRTIDTKGWSTGWDWTHGIGLYGMYQYYMQAGSKTHLKIIQDWFKPQLSAGTTKNINTMAVFLTMAHDFEATGYHGWIPWLHTWGEWAMLDLPRTEFGGFQHMTYEHGNKNQLWDDTLMMTVLPLAKIGKVLKRPHYVCEADRQFLLHVQYLFDPTTGLFFHGWQFDEKAEGGVGHHFARARWARGNCWLTIAMTDYLEILDLPPDDQIRRHLETILEAQCRALRRLRDESGLWRTLLDVSVEDGSYLESSASAGFAYGILKAVRMRYLPKEYLDVGLKAVKAVMGKINDYGELLDTSFGTPMGHDLDFYLKIKRTSMPYGQAMAILALTEFLRAFI